MTTITNNLDVLGWTYTNTDIMSKILRSLIKTWEVRVMAIREANDLTKLPLKELIRSRMTHEIIMEKQELEKKPKKNLEFQTIHHVDSDDNEEVEEKIALIIRQF
ncbi:hypothetical protein NC651_018252 [Populus alba x Populus x berolinensis]|nr:hypothetical protein NC651_018252 [Populus alba x Populus x berolinensis]